MRALASPLAFWWIVALLVVQAAWIALSSHYPMAFDEDFHLGVIKIYAHHVSPFLAGQPAGADAYGAVARDPSYLYHYLFSFPYRFINLFTHAQTTLVLILRGLNIAIAVGGLIIYRRLLSIIGASQAIINGCVLFFVLIPVVPLLAAQINYDNLFIAATGLSLLLAAKFAERIQRQQFDLVNLLWLGVSCLLASLVKYAFLPIFIALGFYLIIIFIRSYRQSSGSFWAMMSRGLRQAKRGQLVLASILLVLSLGLFSQRYIVNVMRYHTPIPDCGKVLSVKQCSAYGPWIRDYNFAINRVDEEHNPLVYVADWLYGMWLRLYFTVDGPATLYQTRGPLPVPSLSAIVIASGGLLVFIFGFRKLVRGHDNTMIWLFMTTGLVYVVTLFFDNYHAYLRTGQPVAINGRYLLPFSLMALVLCTLAGRQLFGKYPRISGVLVVIVLASQLWGGGVLTYILRSNDAWYTSNTSAKANHAVKSVLGPVTPGYKNPAEFLH